jgi:hypothetical protein
MGPGGHVPDNNKKKNEEQKKNVGANSLVFLWRGNK